MQNSTIQNENASALIDAKTFNADSNTESIENQEAKAAKDDLLTTKETAQILGVSTSALENWRSRELFGCKFFTADKKFGNTWYYLRERVEQLKEVYQPGILQSLYKLARKFSDNFQKSPSSLNTHNDAETLRLPDFEVAEILGVSEMTLSRWRESRKFREDVLDHSGVYWYNKERVEKFKVVYDLEVKLKKQLADFDEQKNSAIETLKNAESFDKDFVFSEEILTCAAFAKLYDGKTFSNFKAAIQKQAKKDKINFISEWSGEVKKKIEEIKERLKEQNKLQAKLSTAKFIADNDVLQDFSIPEEFCISDNGIEKVVGEKMIMTARRPVVIKEKHFNTEEKTYKLILSFLSASGKWCDLPAQEAATVFNARKIVDLANYDLPVTSVTANLLVEYLAAFKALNENILPLTYIVSRCGWHSFYNEDYFIEPRRNCIISTDDKVVKVAVDSNSTFAQSLKSSGTIEEWKKAYDLIKISPVARLHIAASIATPLLKILGERNFVLYFHGATRGGKSTCLQLAASAVGNNDLVVSFDGTNIGLLGKAAETMDFPFFVDEKQVADVKLKANFQSLIYAVANGKERLRGTKEGNFRLVREWRNIAIFNGETELLDDNATGGAHTRLLQIQTPKTILDADTCKQIREITKSNYGLIFPLVTDKFLDYGVDKLREKFAEIVEAFTEFYNDVLPEYCRYMAILMLADAFLSMVLGVQEMIAFEEAHKSTKEIFRVIPTLKEIDDSEREKNFVLGFIAAKARQFEGNGELNPDDRIIGEVLGKFEDDFVFVTVRALQTACNESGFDYKKLVNDLVEANFFVPNDKVEKGRKTPYQFVVKKINDVSTRCFRIPKTLI